ncbi:hypothetical protein K8I28_04290 [bacterium]|nr:hypothetical protein [bacterium]
MGEKLMEFYKLISDEKGLSGKMELAKRTKLPSTRAALVPDEEETLVKFREAFKQITGKKPPL